MGCNRNHQKNTEMSYGHGIEATCSARAETALAGCINKPPQNGPNAGGLCPTVGAVNVLLTLHSHRACTNDSKRRSLVLVQMKCLHGKAPSLRLVQEQEMAGGGGKLVIVHALYTVDSINWRIHLPLGSLAHFAGTIPCCAKCTQCNVPRELHPARDGVCPDSALPRY